MEIQIIKTKRKSKYKNSRCIVNNIVFDSVKEGKRYVVLYGLQASGKISLLRLQVPFKIFINGKQACTYKADFVYYDDSGKRIIEDAKGVRTPMYNLKKKMLFLQYGLRIKEI